MKKRTKDENEAKLADKATFRLLLMQTIVCAIAVLFVWLMSLLGGTWFKDVCREGLYDDRLLSGVSEKLYGTTVTTTTTVQPIVTEPPIITTAQSSGTESTYADG